MSLGRWAAMSMLALLMAACGGSEGQEEQASSGMSSEPAELSVDEMATAPLDTSANLPRLDDKVSDIKGMASVSEAEAIEGVDELPWASVNGVAVVNGRDINGEPVDYVFLSTMAAAEGKLYYRAVKSFSNPYKESWDSRGWREMPLNMRTGEKLAAAWMNGDANTVHGRTMYIAAIDLNGKYQIASYTPIDQDGKERWGGWYNMGAAGGGSRFDGPPALVKYGDWFRIMGVRNGTLWHRRYQYSKKTWTDWVPDTHITLRTATGVAASPLEFGTGDQREEQMVLFAVNKDNRVYSRRYLNAGVQPWYEVPGGALTDTTPTAARSSPEALRVIVKDVNGSSLRYQTIRSDTYYPWTNNKWTLLATGDFDPIASGFAGSGGPTAVWMPPTNTANSGSWGGAKGALRVYVEGTDTFNPVYGIRFQDVAGGGLAEKNDCTGILCNYVTTRRVLPGTTKASPTLVPQPTIPQVLLPPRPPMVAAGQTGQAGMPDPILGNVAVASLPDYGTDFLAGTCVGAKCEGRIYYREGHNIGMASALWDAHGWREVPGGFISKHKPAVAAVGGNMWLAAVSADGRKVQLTKYRHSHGGVGSWEPWLDITGNFVQPPPGQPGFFDSPPSIVVGHDFAWVVVRGIDDNIWRRTFSFNTGKFDSDWYAIKYLPTPKGLVPSGSRVVQGGISQAILVAVNTSNHVKYAFATKTGTTPWMDVPGGGLSDASPAVALSAPDKLTVVVKGQGGSSYWYQVLQSNGTWNTGWSKLPGDGQFDPQTQGPSAVYHAGTYWNPSAPNPDAWDATPTLRVFGDTASAGRAIYGTSFVHQGSSGVLKHREQSWQIVPGTYVQPPAVEDPKPKPTPNPGPGIPLPPVPGTPEWYAPIQTEPVNQWYPVCLSWQTWTFYGWIPVWTQTVYHPGEHGHDAFLGAGEVYGSENEVMWPTFETPIGGSAYHWSHGSCP